jgi:hypothetical protein
VSETQPRCVMRSYVECFDVQVTFHFIAGGPSGSPCSERLHSRGAAVNLRQGLLRAQRGSGRLRSPPSQFLGCRRGLASLVLGPEPSTQIIAKRPRFCQTKVTPKVEVSHAVI